MAKARQDYNLISVDELFRLLKCGDIWIERNDIGVFFYVVDAATGTIQTINQDVAKNVTNMSAIVMQRWYEGWGSPTATGIMRWIHVNNE